MWDARGRRHWASLRGTRGKRFWQRRARTLVVPLTLTTILVFPGLLLHLATPTALFLLRGFLAAAEFLRHHTTWRRHDLGSLWWSYRLAWYDPLRPALAGRRCRWPRRHT